MEGQGTKNEKKQQPPLQSKEFRTIGNWDEILHRTRFEYCLKVYMREDRTREEMVDAALTFKPRPFAVRREKGQHSIWLLFFYPQDLDALRDIKKQQFIHIGDYVVKNLHYGLPSGEILKIRRYCVDLGNEVLLPLEEVERCLKSAGVQTLDVERETFKGLETGIISVIASSDHKDASIKIKVCGFNLTLHTIAAKLQQKRAMAKRKKPQPAKPLVPPAKLPALPSKPLAPPPSVPLPKPQVPEPKDKPLDVERPTAKAEAIPAPVTSQESDTPKKKKKKGAKTASKAEDSGAKPVVPPQVKNANSKLESNEEGTESSQKAPQSLDSSQSRPGKRQVKKNSKYS
jgi:hypothetical protein